MPQKTLAMQPHIRAAMMLASVLVLMLSRGAAADDMSSDSSDSSLCGSMFLHQAICDVVLFATFVPESAGQYLGALVTTAVLAAASVCVEAAKRKLIKSRADAILNGMPGPTQAPPPAPAQPPHAVADDDDGSGAGTDDAKSRDGFATKRDSRVVWNWQEVPRVLVPWLARTHYGAAKAWYRALHGGLTFVSVLLRYLVMLIVMTFNVGLILAACAGYAIGSVFFDDLDGPLGSGTATATGTDGCA